MARTSDPHAATVKAWQTRARAGSGSGSETQSRGDFSKAAAEKAARADDKIWETFPEPPEGIAAAEEAWSGGVADFGDRDAAYLIQNMKGYFDYRYEVEARLREVYGGSVPLYRSMSETQFEDWKNGADMGPKSFSLDPMVAKRWANFAGNKGKAQVVVAVSVDPSAIVMRGKREEQELVADVNEISFHTVKTLGRS